MGFRFGGLVGAVLVSAGFAAACSSNKPKPFNGGLQCATYDAGPPAAGETGARVTRAQVDEILALSCSLSASCHGASPGKGQLFLPKPGSSDGDWIPQVLGVPSTENPKWKRVIAGDPQNSWLVQKITGNYCSFAKDCVAGIDPPPCGDRMPQANDPRDFLDARDVKTIIEWIREGAPSK